MQFSILHRTLYRYTSPVFYSIQHLRLTPRDERHQRTLRWRIHAPGPLTRAVDAYGNIAHTLALTESHGDVEIDARGEVEVDALIDGQVEGIGTVPPQSFIASTPLTAVDDRLRAFADAKLVRRDPHGLLDFANEVCAAIAYKTGTTEVTSTAAEALQLARGVCQDQAHVFIACCRARGIPARYVSGYVHPGDAPHSASHAWADAYLPERGWISIDVTHRKFASNSLCRLAVGRDYLSASPVRGVRIGGGDETMEARVNIRPFLLKHDAE